MEMIEYTKTNPGTCDIEVAEATACFIKLVSEWWKIVSNTDKNSAYSFDLPITNFSMTKTLVDFHGLIESVVFVKGVDAKGREIIDRSIKPWQTGIKLLGKSVLQDFFKLLENLDHPIRSFSLGRLSSDIIESFFSELKYKYSKLGPAQVKNAMKMKSLSSVPFRAEKSNTGFVASQSVASPELLVEKGRNLKRSVASSSESFNFRICEPRFDQDVTVKRIIQYVAPKLTLTCPYCEHFSKNPTSQMLERVAQANCQLDLNLDLVIEHELLFSELINQIVNYLSLNAYANHLPKCHGVDFCEMYIREFLNLRIREHVKLTQQAPKKRPDASTTL